MRIVALIAALIVPLTADAQSSKELATQGRTMWAAYDCSLLASAMGDEAETERLFNRGYKAGQSFVAAIRSGRIHDADIRSTVPVGLTWSFGGPTAEFQLGRWYEVVVAEHIRRLGEWMSRGDDVKKTNASNEYRRKNCGLLK